MDHVPSQYLEDLPVSPINLNNIDSFSSTESLFATPFEHLDPASLPFSPIYDHAKSFHSPMQTQNHYVKPKISRQQKFAEKNAIMLVQQKKYFTKWKKKYDEIRKNQERDNQWILIPDAAMLETEPTIAQSQTYASWVSSKIGSFFK